MIYALVITLWLSTNIFCYQLGRLKTRREHDIQNMQTYEQAKKVRDTLHDPGVVDELLQKYKR